MARGTERWKVLAVIAFGLLALQLFGFVDFSKFIPSQLPFGSVTGPAPESELYYGTITIKVNEINYFDGASEPTSSPSYIAYPGRLGPGRGGIAISASGTSFVVDKADEGWLYMSLHPGDSHYIFVDHLRE